MKRTRNRRRTIKLAALNIVTHPHSVENYRKLWDRAYWLKQRFRTHGDTAAMLGSMGRDFAGNVISGDLFTFLDLDPSLPWYDIQSGEEATEQQTKEVEIPAHLKPHLRRFRYVFIPEVHTLVFVHYDSKVGAISPNSVQSFVDRLLNDNRIIQGAPFPKVHVQIVQDKHSLKTIFESIRVDALDIQMYRPNGDTSDDAKKSIEEELDDQNIGEYFVSLKAQNPGTPIKPDSRTSRMMKEAIKTGYVEARGPDEDGIPRTLNTKTHPAIEPYKLDPRVPYADAIVNIASSFLRKFIS